MSMTSARIVVPKNAKRGEVVTRAFTVNVRRPALRGGGSVSLRDSKTPHPDWDDRLTLEFGKPLG